MSNIITDPIKLADGQGPEAPGQNEKEIPLWEVLMASALGGLFLGVADALAHKTLSLRGKIESVFADTPEITTIQIIIITFLLFLILAMSASWIFKPRSRIDAFTRGITVLAILNLVPANGNTFGVVMEGPDSKASGTLSADSQPNLEIIKHALAADDTQAAQTDPASLRGLIKTDDWRKANATFVYDSHWLSKTEPQYYGFLGLGSLIDNALKTTRLYYEIKSGSRVRLIDSFTTLIRGYHYVRIQYMVNGQLLESWTQSGQYPDYWLIIKPDSRKAVYGEPLSAIDS